MIRQVLKVVSAIAVLSFATGASFAAMSPHDPHDICPGTHTNEGCLECCQRYTTTSQAETDCRIYSHCTSKELLTVE